MNEFDQSKVLTRILKEAPTLTNLRGTVEVDGVERVIYAFYLSDGKPDPELGYDRVNDPKPTTPDSTLCEIYSAFGPGWEKIRQKKIREGSLEEGEVLNVGPYIPAMGASEPAKLTREDCKFEFNRTARTFADHFNKICKDLEYDVKLDGLIDSSIQSKRRVNLLVDGRVMEGVVPIETDIGINFDNTDPTLSQTLDAIAKAYARLQTFGIHKARLYVE